jgi:hypothetical protein
LNLLDFQHAINNDYPNAPNNVVMDIIIPQIKQLVNLSISAAIYNGLGNTCINNSFELLGYDFMIDDTFKSTLIEINSNPCLEFACPLLTEIITDVIEHTFRIAIDPLFPPPLPGSQRTKACEEAILELNRDSSKFNLVYPHIE